jgi:hypothetical protein
VSVKPTLPTDPCYEQDQRTLDKFKSGKKKDHIKYVRDYPEETRIVYRTFYENVKVSEKLMRAHEQSCEERPVNTDMRVFFEMVERSVGIVVIDEDDLQQSDEDTDGGELAEELALMRADGYSSDDDDESRVTNNSGHLLKQRKHSKAKKILKMSSTKGGKELVDLEIQDIVMNVKYAILLCEDEDQDEAEDEDEDQDVDEDEDEILAAQKNTSKSKRSLEKSESVKSKPKMSWFVGQAMAVQYEDNHVRVKVFSQRGKDWFPQYNDDDEEVAVPVVSGNKKKKKKKKKQRPFLIQKYSVSNFLCRVDFKKGKQCPDKKTLDMVADCMDKAECEWDENFVQEWSVVSILDHRLSTCGHLMQYNVKWTTDEETWEPLESLRNCADLLRNYEGKHLDSKSIQRGSRLMIACTASLMSNRHQIEFFQFKAEHCLKGMNYFGQRDMQCLTTTSALMRARWATDIVLLWHGQATMADIVIEANKSSKVCAIFSPHAVTKFMQGTNETLHVGFVGSNYCEKACKYWLIPISWCQQTIPR